MNHELTKLLRELDQRREKLQSGPAVIFLQTVRGCPLTCAMCQFEPSRPERISRELLAKVEPAFPNLEVLGIHGYGAPLLGDLDYFVRQSLEHDFVIHMNTTGFFLTRERADLLARTRLSIRFSIPAGTAPTYANIMGREFGRVLDNVAYLVERTQRTDRPADLWFSYIVMEDNLDEIDAFLHRAHDCGIRIVQFMRLRPQPRKRTTIRAKDRDYGFNYSRQAHPSVRERFIERLPEIQAIAADLGIEIEHGSLVERLGNPNALAQLVNNTSSRYLQRRVLPFKTARGICVAPWIGQLSINQSGIVCLCCASAFPVGDLNHSSLDEIWNSKHMRRVRRSFARERFPHLCGYCRGFDLKEYPRNTVFRKSSEKHLECTQNPIQVASAW
ncbi:MAG: hypothetical protein CME06_16320 [Gemmatimonadetes bacterium]|nr:hypothetical protein [Gemmatimonadota bacterium]